MRGMIAKLVFLLIASVAAHGQGNAPGQPMGGAPKLPDAAQIQQNLELGKPDASKPSQPGALKITLGAKSAEWTVATLAGETHQTLNVYNEHVKANQSYSGVLLIDLLKKLGVPDKPRGKDFQLFIVAAGSDGYEVVYSIGEITPDVHDGSVIVADAMDGKPLGENGPLQLVASGEKRPARWVRNLVAVRVMAVQ